MLSRIQDRIGTAGLIVAIVALIAALSGGAYAASNVGLNGKQKNEVKAIAKKSGKPGKPGATGATGATGAKGDTGAPGAAGAPGAKGEKGEEGEEGEKGEKGEEGDPWTAGGTIPAGETVTGSWGTGPLSPAGRKYFPISYALPLAEAAEPILVGATEQSKPGCPGRGGGEFGTGKPGNVPTIPLADPGKLCVYVMAIEGATILGFNKLEYEEGFGEWGFVEGASQTGTLVGANCASVCLVGGSWAVTAPEE